MIITKISPEPMVIEMRTIGITIAVRIGPAGD
ncbi:hypothetical protein KLQUMM071B2_01235 [Klebsiella quasipneumoniae subsp. similipneumoniae]|nr:Uncharacterised protein [Klebsiella quasipneumoniae]STR08128.1 Uncharacterised protein [Klebsiella quasipneumoniae]